MRKQNHLKLYTRVVFVAIVEFSRINKDVYKVKAGVGNCNVTKSIFN